MSADQRLQEIRQEINSCQLCQLAKERLNAVPGEGPANVDIMFIGEAPGFHENRQGKPFVGQAGQFLDELLEAAGVNRDQVFITNVVKCRPPNNRDPLPEELSACQRYLDEQIELLDPRVIVTLGRISMSKFVTDGRISAIHGRTHNIGSRKVVTMYHPAAALHQPALRQTLIEDFARLKRFISAPAVTQPDPQPTVQPPAAERMPAANLQINEVNEEKTIFNDLEDQKPPEQLSLF
ncbi:MAG: uracil-DNA glycosylase [Anaerolineaceae bacterium]|jgi:DNA polymerase|nr:uracil-DNA glycosylase [Anaerolineaceae bacterium]MDD4043260.1 uracil-DNA glycosylase [Anaerolineaceae bacterium]MDD4578455.1 uracil-DNA glycosylase [Anaerolineaceae bacterium]